MKNLAIRPGEIVLTHASLSAFGYVVGGVQTVVQALLRAIGPDGTVMVPTHTPENSDPEDFRFPPLPDYAKKIWIEHYPAYDATYSACPRMGVIAEAIRTLPLTSRSCHPLMSFAAYGPQARWLTADHALEDALGDTSPLGKAYESGAKILLLGVGHDVNTSLHLAEKRAASTPTKLQKAAVNVDGVRRWVAFKDIDWDNTGFESIGSAFEETGEYNKIEIGNATLRLFDMRSLVDFAKAWFRDKKGAKSSPSMNSADVIK